MNFKLCRNRSGMTQEEVAAALGMPKKTYQNYERGVREPDSEVLCALADLYGITIDELVGRERLEPVEEDAREAKLLDLYRSMSAEERKVLLAMAETLSSLHKDDNDQEGAGDDHCF